MHKNTQGQRKLRGLLVGALGNMGRRRDAAFSCGLAAETEVTTVIDLPEFEDRLREHARTTGRTWATQLEAALNGDIDFVVLSTPTHTHAPLALAALEAGKHVFVEKPLASNVHDAERLVRLAQQRGLVLMTGFNRRFWPLTQAAALLLEPLVGQVLSAQAEVSHGQFATGALDQRSRHFLEQEGAGPLLDIGIHAIDLARHFMGRFDVARGSAVRSGRLPGQTPELETADYSKAGRQFSLHTSYIRPRQYMGMRFEMTGTQGFLGIDMASDPVTGLHALNCATFQSNPFDSEQARRLLRERRLRWTGFQENSKPSGGAFFRVEIAYDDAASWLGDCRAFVEAICQGLPEHGRDGLETLKMVTAARRSAAAGGIPVLCEPGSQDGVAA